MLAAGEGGLKLLLAAWQLMLELSPLFNLIPGSMSARTQPGRGATVSRSLLTQAYFLKHSRPASLSVAQSTTFAPPVLLETITE